MKLEAPPLVLYDNVFFDDRANLSAGTEAADWRLGTKWTGTAAANMDTGLLSGRSVNALAVAAHSLSTNGYSLGLYGSTDGVSYTLIDSVTPKNNNPFLLLFPLASWAYYRVRVEGGSGAWAVGVVCAGVFYSLPKAPTDFDPFAREYTSEIPATRYGTPLPGAPRATPSTINYEIKGLDETLAAPGGELHAFMDHAAYPLGKPFFVQWDRHGRYKSDIWFCDIAPGFRFSAVVKPGQDFVEPFTFPIRKMQEA